MTTLFILLVLVVGAVAAYKYRVLIVSRILGQPERRVQRHIERKKY